MSGRQTSIEMKTLDAYASRLRKILDLPARQQLSAMLALTQEFSTPEGARSLYAYIDALAPHKRMIPIIGLGQLFPDQKEEIFDRYRQLNPNPFGSTACIINSHATDTPHLLTAAAQAERTH